MAGQIPDLHATVRTGTGKGAARQSRRNGNVPGIIYGGGQDPLPIEISYNMLLKRLKQGRFLATLFNMKVDGRDDVRVICREVQRDPVKDLPRHVDFMRLRRTTRVNLFVSVEFINEDATPGLKKGGVLTVVRAEIEVNVQADSIPESIVVDLTGYEVGDVITISSVTLPNGVRPTIDRDFTIANISAPSALRSDDDTEEAAKDETSTAEATEEGAEE
ncbi:MAG: 50S ribosomal protein L25/general stress protein Ctc [Pseudomonadota bacterium]